MMAFVEQEESSRLIKEERENLINNHNKKIEELKASFAEKKETSGGIDGGDELHEKYVSDLNIKISELRAEMAEEAEEKEKKAVKEATEKLTAEYKAEIESLRSRFKLMSAAHAEKNLTSDSSLEKVEVIFKLTFNHLIRK